MQQNAYLPFTNVERMGCNERRIQTHTQKTTKIEENDKNRKTRRKQMKRVTKHSVLKIDYTQLLL